MTVVADPLLSINYFMEHQSKHIFQTTRFKQHLLALLQEQLAQTACSISQYAAGAAQIKGSTAQTHQR
jgi:hypothetical protein